MSITTATTNMAACLYSKLDSDGLPMFTGTDCLMLQTDVVLPPHECYTTDNAAVLCLVFTVPYYNRRTWYAYTRDLDYTSLDVDDSVFAWEETGN